MARIRSIVPLTHQNEAMRADIERGSDGQYYIKRKVSAAELASLRQLSADSDEPNIFMEFRTITSSECSNAPMNLPRLEYPPFFITFISIFQLVTFVYYALRSSEPLTLIGPIPYDSSLIYNPHRRYEIWRYVTYMLVHAGFWHISSNLLLQLIVGIPLELVNKYERISIVYIGGVLAGSLGNSVADPYSYLAGASSGCYALVSAHISNLILNWNEIQCACCKLLLVCTFVFIDLSIAIYERHYKVTFTAHRTSYGGHLAGLLGGLLLGIVCLRNVHETLWERMLKKWALSLYLVLMTMAIVFNVKETEYFTPPDRRPLSMITNPFGYQREQ